MEQREIIPELSFLTAPPEGAILQWICDSDGVADIFSVSMSWKSIAACRKALTRKTVRWEINDGSLEVYGNQDKIELTFRMSGPPFGRKTLILEGDSLAAFIAGLDELQPN